MIALAFLAVVLTTLTILYLLYLLDDDIPNDLPWAGDDSDGRPALHKRVLLYLKSLQGSQHMLADGYDRVSKHEPFHIPLGPIEYAVFGVET